MIDIIKQTPIEYSKQSRDYQVISRLYTALFNLVRMYSDNMNVWNNNIDNKLTVLRSTTLNFRPRHSWDLDTLDGAVSCFKYLMMHKGTEEAIRYCILILMRLYKLDGYPDIEYDKHKVVIKVPTQLASFGILEDLLDYILPAGIVYRIIEYKLIDTGIETDTLYQDTFYGKGIKTSDMGIYLFGNDYTKYGQSILNESSEESSEYDELAPHHLAKDIYRNAIDGYTPEGSEQKEV